MLHLISEATPIFSERSLFFNSSSSWSHTNVSIHLPRTGVQSALIPLGISLTLHTLWHSHCHCTFVPLFQDLLNSSTSSPATSAGCFGPFTCSTANLHGFAFCLFQFPLHQLRSSSWTRRFAEEIPHLAIRLPLLMDKEGLFIRNFRLKDSREKPHVLPIADKQAAHPLSG